MLKNFGHYFNRKKTKLIVALAIVLLVIYPFLFSTKKSFADEISLFPTKCEGSWNNVEEATRDPADNLLIGAQSIAVGDTISCHSFDASSLPEDASITNTHLELVWTVVDDKESFVKPSIEESYDQVAPVIEKEIIDQNINIETLETETTPLIEESKPQTLPETNNIESNSNETKETSEPTSRLPFSIRSIFISEALAEEQTAPVVENSEVSNETTADILTEQAIVSETEEKDLPTQETLTSEEKPSESIVPENNIVSDDGSEQIEASSEIIVDAPKEASEVVETGTALYSIFYSISDKKQQSLGQVTQEQLSKTYPLAVSIDDLPYFNVSLTSLLTFDQIDNLALEGIKLVVEYSSGESLDPIRQPDLRVDTVLDRISVEGLEAIRIERADNKQYEIWYRIIESEELTKLNQNNTEGGTIEQDTQTPTATENSVQETPSLTSDNLVSGNEVISETEKFIIESSITESISTPTEIVSPGILSEKIVPKTHEEKRLYWNFVDGDDSIHRSMPIALQEGYIFWLNKKGTVLNSYNILTQGYNSQSFEPESGNNFIVYRSPSSQEKRAILILSEQKFIFSE